MIALPIPDRASPVRYQDLKWEGRSLGDVVEQLTGGKKRRDFGAHLDPDLQPQLLQRPAGWKGLFGQRGAAQGHLREQGISVGDVFIFWGLFRAVDDQLAWCGRPEHVVWGWLQVGAIHGVDAIREGRAEPWILATKHPHLAMPPDPSNTLYVAAESLSAGGGALPGSGAFLKYSTKRRLSASGADRVSVWSLPEWMMPRGRQPLSYHAASGRWTAVANGALLQTVSRGQEFVLQADEYPEAIGWLAGLVRGGARVTP